MFRADTSKIFASIEPSEGYCEDCPFLQVTIEGYEIWGCKEREVELNCSGNHLECQIVEEIAQDVEDFIHDYVDMFELIQETE